MNGSEDTGKMKELQEKVENHWTKIKFTFEHILFERTFPFTNNKGKKNMPQEKWKEV